MRLTPLGDDQRLSCLKGHRQSVRIGWSTAAGPRFRESAPSFRYRRRRVLRRETRSPLRIRPRCLCSGRSLLVPLSLGPPAGLQYCPGYDETGRDRLLYAYTASSLHCARGLNRISLQMSGARHHAGADIGLEAQGTYAASIQIKGQSSSTERSSTWLAPLPRVAAPGHQAARG